MPVPLPTIGRDTLPIDDMVAKEIDAQIGRLPASRSLITSWLGGNSDGATGDFSLGVRGHLIEDGQIGAPVSEMNVTGNLLTLFQALVAVGNDPWKYSPLKAPTLVFEDGNFSWG